ncbi:MAG: M81 family metallopeptidase [Ruminococcaceae bacterium]|nr:M81 family metallopeptidase [Oscillospiraceae bacterium]
MRIAIAALHHETNSFSNLPMTWETMQKTRFEKEKYLAVYTPIRNYSGGFIAKAKELGIDLVPTASAYLNPSGHITDEALENHRDGIVRLLWEAHNEAPLDAIALNLHGAGVADSYPDADGEILRAVRERFGADMPIGCVLDLHANVTREMMEYADLLTGVKGYPHVDEFEAGAEMLEILCDMVKNKWRPFKRHIQLPWFIAPAEGVTLSGPAHDVQQKLYQAEAQEDVINATFFHGFPYSDIEQAGVSVTAMGKTREAADRAALDIARYAWGRRRDFAVPANSAEEAFDLALQIPLTNGPVVINESSDNTGGGTPGDGTHLLREMIKRNLKDSAFGSIHDPEVALLASKAGVGAKIICALGGKIDDLHGEPIELVDAYVKCISDGKYLNLSPMGGGGIRNAGLTALLVVGNVNIVVTSNRGQAMDDGLFRVVGLRHDLLKYVAVKSSQHFKGWWKDRCSGIVPCDSPGIHCANLRVFDFKYANTSYFPLADAAWKET